MTKSSVSQDESLLLPPEPREPCRKPAASAGEVSVFRSCCCTSPRDWGSEGATETRPQGLGETKGSEHPPPHQSAWSTASQAWARPHRDSHWTQPSSSHRAPGETSCKACKGACSTLRTRGIQLLPSAGASAILSPRALAPQLCVPRCGAHALGGGLQVSGPPCSHPHTWAGQHSQTHTWQVGLWDTRALGGGLQGLLPTCHTPTFHNPNTSVCS